jgi:tRNA(Arg) A34 adenosine deaminase TadA
MNTDEQFMQLAIEQAKQAKLEGEWPFGAVIVCDGKVIAQNRCSETASKNILSHAELQTINDTCKLLGRTKLNDCVIYCTNEPCLMCASAIFQAKIPKVVIGASRTDLPHLLRERKLRIDNLAFDAGYEVEIVKGILKDEIIPLFDTILNHTP